MQFHLHYEKELARNAGLFNLDSLSISVCINLTRKKMSANQV